MYQTLKIKNMNKNMLIVIFVFFKDSVSILLAFAMIYKIDTTLNLTVTMGNSDKKTETLRKQQREKEQ